MAHHVMPRHVLRPGRRRHDRHAVGVLANLVIDRALAQRKPGEALVLRDRGSAEIGPRPQAAPGLRESRRREHHARERDTGNDGNAPCRAAAHSRRILRMPLNVANHYATFRRIGGHHSARTIPYGADAGNHPGIRLTDSA
jgi:hypothetical protein